MSSRPSSQAGDLIDRIVQRSRGQKLKTPLSATRAGLLRAYFASVPETDLRYRDPRELAAAALSHITFGANRASATAKVRVFNPTVGRDGWESDATIVQLVNDDMPFLVDSVTMTLNRLGHGVELLIHPILGAERTLRGRLRDLKQSRENGDQLAESFIYIEISKDTDEDVLETLKAALEDTLSDVRAAVEDWPAMLAELATAEEQLRATAVNRADVLNESCELLSWLGEDHFTLLGYREYRLRRGKNGDRLHPVDGTGLGISRDGPGVDNPTIALNPTASKVGRTSTPLVITKTDASSTIHRSGHLDLIGVKIFGSDGKPKAVRRFIGLFTSAAYNERPCDIPLVRLKIRRVMAKSALDPMSHSGKALQHILNTFPRDDLFQASSVELARISTGILRLEERHRVKLFCRRDAFSRFYSCFVYLPRDQYNPRTRQRIEQTMLKAFSGTSIESKLTMSESALARLEATIRIPSDVKSAPNIGKLEDELEAIAETWRDRYRHALVERLGTNEGLRLFHRFGENFPVSYQEEVDPRKSANEIEKIAAVTDGDSDLEMSLTPAPKDAAHAFNFTTIRRDEPIQLYAALPILESMGMNVLSERVYRFPLGEMSLAIQAFELEPTEDIDLDPVSVEERFSECFRRVLVGDAENDFFNSFVVTAGLSWREASLLRAFCKYLLQTRLSFSQSYMREVLSRHLNLTRSLVELFHAQFDPDLDDKRRRAQMSSSAGAIAEQLDGVSTLDEDRILRAFANVIEATLRTNYYQLSEEKEKPYISCKLDPAGITELPEPRPMYEIFVYSPKFEGVHLRCGGIARGGLRWSDRREDFRTEVLGLMKAQQVKNTVIVPTGAKGGFVCKQLPGSGQDAIRTEAVACYKNFIRGLLDITDNIVDDEIVPPDRVVRRDDNDPYLVVAADKGTASFSDYANEVSAEYSFWLGDAFASGGSAGYDHKGMGITARGAWECVKRHFRELGIDTQKQEITVSGIGDMSGDVFGNGMLMSRHIRLVAAFNHRHIFIDPDPDAQVSFSERRRLFRRPRSGWDDYDIAKLSDGGGVYSRDSKSIELSSKVQKLLNLNRSSVTPPELVRAILRMKVDLLWSGGIGTYIKASQESNADVRDPTNDLVRIDANSLRCRVLGEGGNLAITQAGRIEFATCGGRLNTDFIDNSGGVDTSDREVNLKILLSKAIAEGKLGVAKRDDLLAGMTEEIAALVLRNNYSQSQALSMMSATKSSRLGESVALIRNLETRGLLDRKLENLPSEDELDERRKSESGLTRPELAVIMSYAKIDLYNNLIDSDAPEDPYLSRELVNYFPARLHGKFKKAILSHRLHREIIAMRIADSTINRMGAAFAIRAEKDTGATSAQIARAYTAVREIFEIRELWQEIEACDNQIPSEVQYDLLFQISRAMRHAVYWLLRNRANLKSIEEAVARYRNSVRRVHRKLAELESIGDKRRREIVQLQTLGVPSRVARRLTDLARCTQTFDIIEIAADRKTSVSIVTSLYFELGRGLRLGWIRDKIEGLEVDGRWAATARATLREQHAKQQDALVRSILARRGSGSPQDALTAWLTEAKDDVKRAKQNLRDMETSGEIDFATLSVAIREIERLT
ncbi:MAG: NAD-glutamate dehydrogenase [Candidatus Rariloculaceae bacterium]